MCSLFIFLDETEDENYFLVGGIVTSDREELLDAIHETRRFIKSKKGLVQRHREQILNEIKDYYLVRWGYEDIKVKFLENIRFKKIKTKNKKKSTSHVRSNIIVAYMKFENEEKKHLSQVEKEEIYYQMLCSLLSDPKFANEKIEIIYDEYGNAEFRDRLTNLPNHFKNLIQISPGKSNIIKELQAADVCVGCIRRSLSGENLEIFTIIEEITYIIGSKTAVLQ